MTHVYLQQIESSLASFTWAKSVQVLRCDVLETDEEEILVYRFRVSLSDSSLLEMMERVVTTKKDGKTATTTYRFHLQDHTGNLIKRWDNAPHFSGLNNFPHHIHMGKEDHIIPGRPINGLEILDEINRDFFDADEESKK